MIRNSNSLSDVQIIKSFLYRLCDILHGLIDTEIRIQVSIGNTFEPVNFAQILFVAFICRAQ